MRAGFQGMSRADGSTVVPAEARFVGVVRPSGRRLNS